MSFNSTRKLMITAVLFLLAIGLVATASASRSVVPLFFTWIPLLTVPWVLTRPESPFRRAPDVSEQAEDDSVEAPPDTTEAPAVAEQTDVPTDPEEAERT